MENKEGRWLFIIKTDDRPGAAASVAVAFSGRGLQIESFIGYGDINYHSRNTEGVIAITFQAFERQVHHVARVLTRLEQVRELDVYHYDDPQLTKTATVRISRPVRELQSLAADCDIFFSVGTSSMVKVPSGPVGSEWRFQQEARKPSMGCVPRTMRPVM